MKSFFNRHEEEIEENISMGKPFALRPLSMGDPETVMEFTDTIKGKRKMTLVGSIISFEEVSVYKNRPFMFTTLF